jgi:dethiobiotin synthetase
MIHNQALLSIEAAKKHKLNIAMLVLNQITPNSLDNAKALSAFSSNATTSLVINNEAISFKARFDGKSQNIYVPTDAVLTIYTGKVLFIICICMVY